MSKYDAERALAIYKTFSKQTNEVVDFLGVARQYENATRLEIPKLKHAPTGLTSSLEEYLNDPDFEINRRQYLAQQEAKKGGKSTSNGTREPLSDFGKLSINKASSSQSFPEPKLSQAQPPVQEPKGPAPDLIDFFESVEQNQQPMAALPQQQISNFQSVPQYQYQQQGFPAQAAFTGMQNQPQQQVNGFSDGSNSFGQPGTQQQQQQMHPAFTGVGFGGFSQQPAIQPQVQAQAQAPQSFSPPIQNLQQTQSASFPPQQSPFASTLQQSPFVTGQQQSLFTTGQQQSSFATGPQTQSTNPFRQSMMPQATTSSTPPFSGTPVTSPLTRQSTNPFARGLSSQQSGPSNGTPFNSPPPMQSPPSMPPSSTASSFFATPLQSPDQQMQPQPLQPTRTGTNPFARSAPQSQSQAPLTSPLVPNQTGTNPFRQSAFINQQTGQGWQATQGTMGGLEQLETIPVFPRPGQQQQQQTWPH